MSVMLKPVNEVEAEDSEGLHLANGTWSKITASVKPWDGTNDEIRYTPEELRAMASENPEWAEWLNWLAAEGGAILG